MAKVTLLRMPTEVLRRCVRVGASLVDVHHIASTCRRIQEAVRHPATWAGVILDCTDERISAPRSAKALLTWSATLQKIRAIAARPQQLEPLAKLDRNTPLYMIWRYEYDFVAELLDADGAVPCNRHVWSFSDPFPPLCMPPLVTEIAWRGRPFTVAIGITSAGTFADYCECGIRTVADDINEAACNFALEFRFSFDVNMPNRPGWVLNGVPQSVDDHGPWMPVCPILLQTDHNTLEVGITWNASILRVVANSRLVSVFDMMGPFPDLEFWDRPLRAFLHATYLTDDDSHHLRQIPRPILTATRRLYDSNFCSICPPRRRPASNVCGMCSRPYCRMHFTDTDDTSFGVVKGCKMCLAKLASSAS